MAQNEKYLKNFIIKSCYALENNQLKCGDY